MFLLFNTQPLAESVNNLISERMGFTGNLTQKWSDVIPYKGKFAIVKPDNAYMSGVTNCTELEFLEEFSGADI